MLVGINYALLLNINWVTSESLAFMSRHICTSYVDPNFLLAFTSCRLIALNKTQELVPLRLEKHSIGKAFLAILRDDIMEVCTNYVQVSFNVRWFYMQCIKSFIQLTQRNLKVILTSVSSNAVIPSHHSRKYLNFPAAVTHSQRIPQYCTLIQDNNITICESYAGFL